MITAKIVEYSLEGEKRLIRLSTLRKYFKKYEGLETTFDTDQKILQLWENFQSLSAIEAPVREVTELNIEENNEKK